MEKIPIQIAEKLNQEWLKYRNTLQEETDDCLEEIFEKWLSERLNKFKRTCKIKIRMEQTLQEVKEEMGFSDKKPTGTYFITICPKDDIPIYDFVQSIHILFKYQWINKACGTIEQRGTTEETMGNGKHFHFLAEVALGVAKKTIIKKIASMYKQLNLDIPEQCIDVKPCTKSVDIPNRIGYMTDNKATDEEKSDKYCMDEPYRIKENIQRWFLKNTDEFWGEEAPQAVSEEPLTSP